MKKVTKVVDETNNKSYVIRFSIEEFSCCGKCRMLVNRLWIDEFDKLLDLLENDKFIDFLESTGLVANEK
ncbi:TPA: hypothetical protein R1756_001656 [Campylobacter jejuni]|nr:hypothetical protein [Campylobacter jejuni]